MFSLKFKTTKFKENRFRYLFLVLALALLISLKFYGLMFCIIGYILLNVISPLTPKGGKRKFEV